MTVNIRGSYISENNVRSLICSAPVKSGDWCTLDSNGNIKPVTASSVTNDIYCVALEPGGEVFGDGWSLENQGGTQYAVYHYAPGSSVPISSVEPISSDPNAGQAVWLLCNTKFSDRAPMGINISLDDKNISYAPVKPGYVIALPQPLCWPYPDYSMPANNFLMINVGGSPWPWDLEKTQTSLKL